MWLNAALTWQIDLKRGKKKVQRWMPSPPAPLSVLSQLRNISLFFFFSFSYSPSLFSVSCLGDWCSWGEPECERGPPRADEDCLSKACLESGTVILQHFSWLRVHMHVCACMEADKKKKKALCACLEVCVCLVLVSTPHSLIKGWGKPLTGRLNLKG